MRFMIASENETINPKQSSLTPQSDGLLFQTEEVDLVTREGQNSRTMPGD